MNPLEAMTCTREKAIGSLDTGACVPPMLTFAIAKTVQKLVQRVLAAAEIKCAVSEINSASLSMFSTSLAIPAPTAVNILAGTDSTAMIEESRARSRRTEIVSEHAISVARCRCRRSTYSRGSFVAWPLNSWPLLVAVTLASRAHAQCADMWTLASNTGPAPRSAYAMAFDESRGTVLLFGGFGGPGIVYGDTWEWDGTTWTNLAITGPAARFFVSMVYDEARARLILFGGRDASLNRFADTWAFSGGAWTLLSPPGSRPSARYGSGMAYDSIRDRVVLFAGFTTGNQSDTWEFDGTAWQQRFPANPRPAARAGGALAFDTGRARTVLFGGSASAGTALSDTWEWDGTSWEHVVSAAPPGYMSGLAYDPFQRVVLRFGGHDGATYTSNTLSWNGVTWQSLNSVGPQGRDLVGLAYDTPRRTMVAFGGRLSDANALSSETWVWRFTHPAIGDHPDPLSRCPGAPAVFSVMAAGTLPLAYQWRRNTLNLSDELNHVSGSQSASLVLTNTIAADEGEYDCIVTNVCGIATSTVASLTICLSDMDNGTGSGACDGGVGIEDLLYYLGVYDAGTTRADVDDGTETGHPDGGVGIEDLLYYLQRYDAGC